MDAFLIGLLVDLQRRCELLLARLQTTQQDPDLNAQALDAYIRVERVRRDCKDLLASPALGAPSLLPNHLRLFNLWSQDVTLVEYFLLPSLERYAPTDKRITALCRRLIEEVGWPLPHPLVVASSNDYYWTFLAFNTIWVPATEDTRLLGLSDLAHELTHNLYVQRSSDLVGNFAQELATYIHDRRQRDAAAQNPRDPRHLQLLAQQWGDAWLQEFVCDMVATFLLGPVFGYQHVRLCVDTNSDLCHPALGEEADHPANEARLRGIVAMLRQAGVSGLTALESLWEQYTTVRAETRPPEYEICYPQTLIDTLAASVAQGCATMGLRRYDEQTAVPEVVRAALQQAWEAFLTDPAGYADWESQRVESLWRELGV